MAQSLIQTSFAAGELSPSLFARVDLDKYHVGAALLSNYFVDFRGGASTRAGTQFLARTKASGSAVPRIIPFIVSTSASYVIEMGDQYFRFLSNGALVTEPTTAITGITSANPAVVHDVAHGYTTGDEVFIFGVVGMTEVNGKNFLLTVVDADHYSLSNLSGVPVDSTAYGAYVSGGTAARIYTLTTPYAITDLPLLKFVQSADVMTFVHPSYAPRNLRRVTASTFTLTAVVVGPTVLPPTALTGTFRGSSAADYVSAWVITSVSLDGKEESLPTTPTAAECSILTTANLVVLHWTAPVSSVSHYNIYRVTQVSKSNPMGTVFGYIGQSTSTSFTDNGLVPDFSKVPPQFADPFSPGEILAVRTNAGGTFVAHTYFVPLTITDATGTGAAGYAIIDSTTNAAVGAVITAPGKNYAAPTITAVGTVNATFTSTVGSAIPAYPSCDAYYQQRRIYGALNGSPEKIVASQIANYDNFDTTPISLDTDAITLTLTSRQVNDIKSMTAMSTGMIVLTSGGGFLVSGGSTNNAFTPATASAFPQASSGANDMPPLVVNNDLLYVQARGTAIRDLAFNFYIQSYTGQDRTVLASHLFYGYTLKEWAYAEEPNKIIWVVRTDGVALSMTYVPEQEVYGWARHSTNGTFVSVCSIPEGSANAVYFIVNRTINGVPVNYIERLASRIFTDILGAWCVDSGLNYTGVPVGTVSGLDHLAGATVTGLADGLVVPPRVVSADGVVTLDNDASVVILGLGFTCDIQTLRLDLGSGTPTVQAKRKLVSAVTLRVAQTAGLQIGHDFTTMWTIKELAVPYTSPNTLTNNDLRSLLDPRWEEAGQICIRQAFPLPATILGLIPEVTFGDTAR